jgi:predicted DNA-binding transcriptional regulator AlpA
MNIPDPEIMASLDLPIQERPDWGLMSRYEVMGTLGVSKSTFYLMIKKGVAPKGQQILARTKMWTVGQIKELAARLHNGEFSGVKLWEKKQGAKRS